MDKPEYKTIYLIPEGDGQYTWCDCPAPGLDMDEKDATKYIRADELKRLATEFFYWWHNQPGTNTQQGFDEWIKLNKPPHPE